MMSSAITHSQQYFFVFQARADKSKNANPRGNNAGPEFPPGLEGFLPQDPFERERMIEEQRRIEQVSLITVGIRNPTIQKPETFENRTFL